MKRVEILNLVRPDLQLQAALSLSEFVSGNLKLKHSTMCVKVFEVYQSVSSGVLWIGVENIQGDVAKVEHRTESVSRRKWCSIAIPSNPL